MTFHLPPPPTRPAYTHTQVNRVCISPVTQPIHTSYVHLNLYPQMHFTLNATLNADKTTKSHPHPPHSYLLIPIKLLKNQMQKQIHC